MMLTGAAIHLAAASDGTQALLGYSAEDFLSGKITLNKLIHADDQEIVKTLFSPVSLNMHADFNIRIRHANGRICSIQGHCNKIATAEGVVLDLLLQDTKNLQKPFSNTSTMPDFIAMMENVDGYIELDTLLVDICTREVIHLNPGDTVGNAAHLMASKRISSLIVTDNEKRPVGIVTERDILRAMQMHCTLESPVQVIMSYPVITVPTSETCLDAYHICLRAGIRHLAIVDEDKRLFGVVTETDFRLHINPASIQGQRQIASVMTRSVFCVSPDTHLEEALSLMHSHKETCVVVVQESRPIGILTERDVVRLFSTQTKLSGARLSSVMTAPVRTIPQNSTIKQCAEIMRATRIRHLVAVDGQGCVRGIVSEHELTNALSVELVDDKNEALCQQLAFATALNSISKTIVEHESTDPILQSAISTVCETLSADRVLLFDISLSDHLVTGKYEYLNPLRREIGSALGTYSLNLFINDSTSKLKMPKWLVSHHDLVNPLFQDNEAGVLLHQQQKTKSLLWHPFYFHKDGMYLLAINQVLDRKEWMQTEMDFLDSVSQLLNIALDKIELLRAREQASDNLRIAATAFESLEAMLITDANKVILRANPAFLQITGYTDAEIIGRKSNLLKSDFHNSDFFQHMWESISATGKWGGEIWNRRKNGEIFPAQISITAVKNDEGKVINYVASFIDITERKKAEEALRGSENRLMMAQRIARIGNCELDLVSNKTWWSEEIFRICEIDPDHIDASFEEFLSIVHPDDRSMVNKTFMNSLKNKSHYDIEYRLLLQNGQIKYVHERCETIFDQNGKAVRSVSTVQDITERKLMKLEGGALLRRIESLILELDDRLASTPSEEKNVTGSEEKPTQLSKRHLDVLELIATGFTSAEIAERLNISQTTVITHRRNLMRKLGLHSAAELTAYAIKKKIVS